MPKTRAMIRTRPTAAPIINFFLRGVFLSFAGAVAAALGGGGSAGSLPLLLSSAMIETRRRKREPSGRPEAARRGPARRLDERIHGLQTLAAGQMNGRES